MSFIYYDEGQIMRYLRGFIVISAFIIFGLGSLILSFVFLPISCIFLKKNQKRKFFCKIIHKLWKFFTEFLIFVRIINLKVDNFENVKGKIIAATHPSLIDIVILTGLFENSLCLAKKELLNNIFLKNIIKNVYIPNDIDLNEFKDECVSALKDGYNIIIFPTGTRTSQKDEIKIHKGSALLQIASGADILPVKIECDYPFLQKNKPIYDAGTKVINYKIEVKPEIKLSQFFETSEIKLRKVISERIKFDFNT